MEKDRYWQKNKFSKYEFKVQKVGINKFEIRIRLYL